MKKYFIPFLFTFIIFTVTQKIIAQKKSFTANKHQTISDDDFDQKLYESTNRIKPILDTDKFNSGNIDDVRDCVKDIQSILVSSGIDRGTANGLLGDLFDVGGKGSSGSGAGVIDYNGGGRDPMTGRIGQDAWNGMCSDFKRRANSGNGDLQGGGMWKYAAEDCIRQEEEMTGSEISDFRKSTYTNSITTSAPKLKDGEKLSHVYGIETEGSSNSDSDSDNSSDTGATSDNSDNTSNASSDNNDDDDSSNSSSDNSSNDDDENSSNDNNSSSSDSEDSSSDDSSSSSDSDNSSSDDDKKKKEEDSSWGNNGGGGSEDPVDNEQGGVPMSAEAERQAKKLIGEINPQGQSGLAGGNDDGRGGEKGDQGNGMMQTNIGIYGSTDDERIQNKTSKGSTSGPIKTTKQEQFGGTIKVQDHN